MTFEKLKLIEGGHGGCLCCGYQHEHLPLDAIIGVGFGYAALSKNDKDIWREEPDTEYFMSVSEAEQMARQDPENDWRIHFVAPLSERHYQRQGDDLWVLYEKGLGFA